MNLSLSPLGHESRTTPLSMPCLFETLSVISYEVGKMSIFMLLKDYIINTCTHLPFSLETLASPSYFLFFRPLFVRGERCFFCHSWHEITSSIVFFPISGFSFPIKWFLPHRYRVFLCFHVFIADLLRFILSLTCCSVFYHQLVAMRFITDLLQQLVVPSIDSFFMGIHFGSLDVKG